MSCIAIYKPGSRNRLPDKPAPDPAAAALAAVTEFHPLVARLHIDQLLASEMNVHDTTAVQQTKLVDTTGSAHASSCNTCLCPHSQMSPHTAHACHSLLHGVPASDALCLENCPLSVSCAHSCLRALLDFLCYSVVHPLNHSCCSIQVELLAFAGQYPPSACFMACPFALSPLDQTFVLDGNKHTVLLHLDPGSPIWMLLHSFVNLGAEVQVGKRIIQMLKLCGNCFAHLNPFNPLAIELCNVLLQVETQTQTASVRLCLEIWVFGEKDLSPELRSTG
eukprot:337001-Rhodomonas_salina.2